MALTLKNMSGHDRTGPHEVTDRDIRRVVEKAQQRFPHGFAACLVLGSGLRFPFANVDTKSVYITRLREGSPAASVPGHDGTVSAVHLAEKTILVIQGRLHMYEGYSAHEAALPALLATELGIRLFITTCAAGGLNPRYEVGDFMLFSDFLLSPLARPLADGRDRSKATGFGPVIPNRVLPALLRSLLEASLDSKVSLQRGVYAYCSGPSYETRSEIAMLRRIGADAVGMSTVPELIAACTAGMQTIALACITNRSLPVRRGIVSHEEVVRVSSLASQRLSDLLLAFFSRTSS